MGRPRTANLQMRGKGASAATTVEPFLHFVSANKKQFDSLLNRQLRMEQRRFPKAGKAVQATTGALIALCQRGGKRVRPALLLAGAYCVTDSPNLDVLIQAGSALELLHSYFLVHDDWMDGDLVRRGGPSVHADLRAQLGNDALGDAAAIMAGDWGVAVATDWMAKLAVPAGVLQPALSCFAEMQLAAVTGQIRDLLANDDQPLRTYELKTASYTVNGPLRLGALLSGAKRSELDALEQYALPLGVAFQLRDDMLGVFSPELSTGKPFASDLRQGKRTVLLLEGLRRARRADRALLDRVLGNPKASRRDLERAVTFLSDSGARAAVNEQIGTLAQKALLALAKSRLRVPGKQLLASAVVALTDRGS